MCMGSKTHHGTTFAKQNIQLVLIQEHSAGVKRSIRVVVEYLGQIDNM
jgi:hypothetical protein